MCLKHPSIKRKGIVEEVRVVKDGKYPIKDGLVARLEAATGIIDLEALRSEPTLSPEHLLSHQMLTKYRTHVIKTFKDPLRKFLTFGKNLSVSKILKVMAIVAKRFPAPTKRNTAFANTHLFLDLVTKYMTYENNPPRSSMLEPGFKIAIAEYEHDPYYRDRADWGIEEIVKAVLDGRLRPRLLGHPIPNADNPNSPLKHWNEPAPYGGKHSIVYKIQNHRKEILAILEKDDE